MSNRKWRTGRKLLPCPRRDGRTEKLPLIETPLAPDLEKVAAEIAREVNRPIAEIRGPVLAAEKLRLAGAA